VNGDDDLVDLLYRLESFIHDRFVTIAFAIVCFPFVFAADAAKPLPFLTLHEAHLLRHLLRNLDKRLRHECTVSWDCFASSDKAYG